MQNLLNEEVSQQIKDVLSPMQNPIKMVLFTKEGECNTCAETKQLLNEVKALNDKIFVEFKDIDKDTKEVKAYTIEHVPSFVILDHNNNYKGVKFVGIPAGHEINSFISAMMFMSGLDSGVNPKILERLAKIDQAIDIKVFTTMGCPHCPGAVTTAHTLAMLNENIEASMVESQTFMDLSMKYKVSGVPKIVINETYELVGNHPIEAFLNELEKIQKKANKIK